MLFAEWMALSGETLVVGAPLETSSAIGINGDEKSTAAPDSGAAYVFVRTPTGWQQQAYLKPPEETRAGDFFGGSVAISGDTLAIGSVRRDLRDATAFPTRSGVAFVYTRSGGVWSFQQELSASDASIGDTFGYSLALDGDTLAVGCPIVGQLGQKYGAVYTFNRTAGMWQQSQKLVSPDPNDLGQFGSFLSMAGDSLAVSAQEDANKVAKGGAVYMFTRRDMRWVNPQRLEPQPPRENAWFGFETALLGDRLAVGAPSADFPNRTDEESGEVWLYDRKADRWENTTVLKAPLPQRGDLYGTGVALAPDALLISSPGENGGSMGVGGDPNRRDGAQTGAAYLYAYTDDGWKLSTYFKASNPGKLDGLRRHRVAARRRQRQRDRSDRERQQHRFGRDLRVSMRRAHPS
jgi:trimeric autotransporter adhesin